MRVNSGKEPPVIVVWGRRNHLWYVSLTYGVFITEYFSLTL